MHRLTSPLVLAAFLAAPLLLMPADANASCADRKMTGTVLGGVGGALIGNSIARGGGGALLGGLGGAVIGHEVAGSGCHRARYVRYGYRQPERLAAEAPPVYGPRVYYDQYGNPVQVPGAPPIAPTGGYGSACPTETRSFYDDRGALVQRSVQVCAR